MSTFPGRRGRVTATVLAAGLLAAGLTASGFGQANILPAMRESRTGVVAGTAPVLRTGFITSQGLFLAKVCAAATVISVPVLAAGFAARNKLVQGLSLGAVT